MDSRGLDSDDGGRHASGLTFRDRVARKEACKRLRRGCGVRYSGVT